jgi:electron transport complex protein RnfC
MVRLEEHKHSTEHKPIDELLAPARVYLPLSQHLGKSCISSVKPGDNVLLGQEIASVQANVFSPIHASVSGKVISIQDWPHPVLGRAKAIVIENDGNNNRPSSFVPRPAEQIARLTPDEIRQIVLEAGIVGMGGAGFPTHIKLNPPKPVDTLIINGAECEPYLTGDYRLMLERCKEILLGVEIVARCLGAKNVFIAIEENKPEAIKLFQNTVHGTRYTVHILKSNYPQGGEKQLIKNVLNKEVPSGKLPFEVGVVVHNVATLYAIYEAVYLNKNFYERVVTVTGNCLANPKNLLVRLGTPIKDLIAFCGPLIEEPAKMIIGGPMMGLAQFSQDVPVIKTTTGVILFTQKEARAQEEEFCIRCGACVRECPSGLMPCLINLAAQKELWEQTQKYGAMDCIECGVCSYVCPANRRLVQSIKRAKLEFTK